MPKKPKRAPERIGAEPRKAREGVTSWGPIYTETRPARRRGSVKARRVGGQQKRRQAVPLRALLAMPLAERIAAVAKDVRRKRPRLRRIPAKRLAEALGIPEPEIGVDGWTGTQYVEKHTLESYAKSQVDHSPYSCLLDLIKEKLAPWRYAYLEATFDAVQDDDDPRFDFLSAREREALEDAIYGQLLGEMSQPTIVRYCLETPDGDRLESELDWVYPGELANLRTPYDAKAGRFFNAEGYSSFEL